MKSLKKSILIFISGHGYGHVSRMSHIIKALIQKNLKIIVIADTNPKFFQSPQFKSIKFIKLSHDVGLIQSDSFNVDINQTLNRLEELYTNQNKIIEYLLDQLKSYKVLGILSDTSPFGIYMGKILSVPSYFIGNFTWTDIYYDLIATDTRFKKYITNMEKQYLNATKCFILPMHTTMKPFPKKTHINIPMLSPNPSIMTKKDWKKTTGRQYSTSQKKVLLSFGGFDFNNLPIDCINSFSDDYLFITTRAKGRKVSKNLVTINPMCKDYLGLIKFSDIVITKPGYGIIADCLVHQKPIIYTGRERFIEYDVLKKWLKTKFPSVFIPNKDLISGNWKPFLKKVLKLKTTFPNIPLNGAEVVVNYLKKQWEM